MANVPKRIHVLAPRERPYADLTCDCGGGTRVVDSRGTKGAIRRRRECLECRRRFTTYEARAEHVLSESDVRKIETLEAVIHVLIRAGIVKLITVPVDKPPET
jgi:transcriptional regulator NrdR family protein